jgi:hypothetical protein
LQSPVFSFSRYGKIYLTRTRARFAAVDIADLCNDSAFKLKFFFINCRNRSVNFYKITAAVLLLLAFKV